MHKFFTEEIDGVTAVIRGDDHKHIFKVLRLKPEEKVLVNDLKGKDYLGEVEEVFKDHTVVRITGEATGSNESPIETVLYQGIPKAGKMDLIVQKTTELGITRIVPVITERVVRNDSEYKKMDRLRRIALEASKQSKRSMIPEIREPKELSSLEAELKGFDLIVVPYEQAEGYGLNRLKDEVKGIRSCAIIIGPEGGFTEEEIATLERIGARVVTLGRRILRTETAGLAALTMIQMIYGDMGGI